jgi:CRP-like cAMP-binding protein/Fe-S-cluster-containing hydrogenase component 2
LRPPSDPAPQRGRFPLADLGVRPGDSLLGTEALLGLGIFDATDSRRRLEAILDRSPGAVVLRRYRAGETVVRQGEPGFSAFYILTAKDLRAAAAALPGREDLAALAREASAGAGEGAVASEDEAPAVEVLLAPAGPRAPVPRGGLGGLLDRLLGRAASPRAGRRTVPVDAPVDLSLDHPLASLKPGDIFGEMACMAHAPRAATIRALRDCCLLELLRNVFVELQRSPTLRARIDGEYRRRALSTHLENAAVFHGLERDLLAHVASAATLERRTAGEVIFRQGDPSDAMYIVRTGLVTVRQRTGDVERVIGYLPRGDSLGEIGLIRGEPRSATCIAYRHAAGAEPDRPEAAGYVDLVRIDRPLFEEVRARSAEFDRRVREVSERRIERDRTRPRTATGVDHAAGLGLLQGQRLMLIDEARCTRCDACVEACADAHDGRTRLVRDGPRFGGLLVPTTCRQCLDPVCMVGCPVASIRRGDRGEICIESWCIGCGKCAESCPYGAILMHERRPDEISTADGPREVLQQPEIAIVCALCAPRGGAPRCVAGCPHEAAMRVDAIELFVEGAGRDRLPRGSAPC